MKIARRKLTDAISYRRVSTDKQGESGIGLDGQLAAIETYASLDRFRITDSFQDVGSGRGRRNLVDRPGLQKAIEVAKATGRPILVSGLDRISREAKTINEIINEQGITVISAGDGKLRNPLIIASESARAQREGELISQRTQDALARKKAEGAQLGNPTNLPQARRLAVARKKEIADNTVDQIRAVLEELAGRPMTDRQLVDVLNQRGILTSTKRPWTLPAIRRPARAARELIRDRAASNSEDHYKDHPLFGRF
ncbi:recombinase family protein [Mesorhizobium sp. ASY16-5R]|uniref:recombinase family protein n=1 Tax=Mesorhizobium sp. ASY16-5R TaxID=3445772 RepID=UPI003FA0F616